MKMLKNIFLVVVVSCASMGTLWAQEVNKPFAMAIYETDALNPDKSRVVAYFDEMRLLKREAEEFGILELNIRYNRLTSIIATYDKTYGFAVEYTKLLAALSNADTVKTLKFVEEIKVQSALEEMVQDYRPSNKWFKVTDDSLNSYNLRKPLKQDGEEVEESPANAELRVPGQLIFDEDEISASQVAPDEDISPEASSPFRFKTNIKLESFGKVFHIVVGTPEGIAAQVEALQDPISIFQNFWQYKSIGVSAFQSEIGEQDLMIDGVEGAYLVNLKQQNRSFLVMPCFERIDITKCRDVVIPSYKTEISDAGDWDIYVTDETLFNSVFKPMLSNYPPGHPNYKDWPLQYQESTDSIGMVKLTPPEEAPEDFPEYAVRLKFPADNSSGSTVQFKLAQSGRWQYKVIFSGEN